MADVPAAAPVLSVKSVEVVAPKVSDRGDRFAGMMAAKGKVAQVMPASIAGAAAAAETGEVGETKPIAKPAPAIAPAPKAADAKPAEPKLVESKPAEQKPEAAPDLQTKRGLDAVERRATQLREENARSRAELDLERQTVTRLRQEAEGKVASVAELKKLAKDPAALFRALGITDQPDIDRYAQHAYWQSSAAKDDPKAKAYLEQQGRETAREREWREKYEQLETKVAELDGAYQRSTNDTYVEKYLDDAVKAIPSDKPTLIGLMHGKSPARARQALLAVGAELEKTNDNQTPTHAEVIAEFERLRRAELEEQGVDVDALLTPAAAAAAKPAPAPPTRTLDPASPGPGARPQLAKKLTRDEQIADVAKGRRAMLAASGD